MVVLGPSTLDLTTGRGMVTSAVDGNDAPSRVPDMAIGNTKTEVLTPTIPSDGTSIQTVVETRILPSTNVESLIDVP